MPVVEKPEGGGSYEGAICLNQKEDLYTEDLCCCSGLFFFVS